ncbi:hypothetical protein HYV49_05215 [Candidatus Pacearchaeota archaeon]|nr:hypothetical protein [Candidatus Pacearchaeota archaeon]
MKKLVLSENQLKDLFALLDLNLKLNGLTVLQKTVDLYNVLMTAEAVIPAGDISNED